MLPEFDDIEFIILGSSKQKGYSIFTGIVPGLVAEGETRREALKNIKKVYKILKSLENAKEIRTKTPP